MWCGIFNIKTEKAWSQGVWYESKVPIWVLFLGICPTTENFTPGTSNHHIPVKQSCYGELQRKKVSSKYNDVTISFSFQLLDMCYRITERM